MIKKKSTKPEGFKNVPHLKSASYPNDSSNSGSWIPEIDLIPAICYVLVIFLILLLGSL